MSAFQSDLLGVVVSEVLDYVYPPDLNSALQIPFGFRNPGNVGDYVGLWARGRVYGASTDQPRQRKSRLERLAIFLYCVGIEEEHPLIQELTSGYSHFPYPPQQDLTSTAETVQRMIQIGRITTKLKRLDQTKLDRAESHLDTLLEESPNSPST